MAMFGTSDGGEGLGIPSNGWRCGGALERRRLMKRIIVLVALVISTMVAATSATAAPTNQTGLVNVNIGDVTLQVPIALAANACDLNVAALVALIVDVGEADCTANANAVADSVTAGNGGGNGPTNQTGLVNVNIGDVTVQVPVAAALNLCDINIAVLAAIIDAGGTSCDAVANSKAKNK